MDQESRSALKADRHSWTFAQLIDWHLVRGTRPGERADQPIGKQHWTNDEVAKRLNCVQKTVRNWRNGRTVPPDPDYQAIESLLFGEDENQAFGEWRRELRAAHHLARANNGRASSSGSPGALANSAIASENAREPAQIERSKPVATVKKKRDPQGRFVEEAYFDASGNPALGKDGAPRVRWEYDERGRVNAVAYFESDGSPRLNPGGAARITWKFDDQGRTIDQAFFGVDGKPVLGVNEGVARVTWTFDDQARTTEEAYFGIDGEPRAGRREGVPRARWEFDAQGRVIAVSYFDGAGRPMLNPAGVARAIWIYDAHGGSEEKRFGVDWIYLPEANPGSAG